MYLYNSIYDSYFECKGGEPFTLRPQNYGIHEGNEISRMTYDKKFLLRSIHDTFFKEIIDSFTLFKECFSAYLPK